MSDKKCAWCKIDTENQLSVIADAGTDGVCPSCGCYNDDGQRHISINNMRQIYDGAVQLMGQMVDMIEQYLAFAGVDFGELKAPFELPEGEPIIFSMYAERIVETLFLSKTCNSGGTSCRNLVKRLGITKGKEEWLMCETPEEDEL